MGASSNGSSLYKDSKGRDRRKYPDKQSADFYAIYGKFKEVNIQRVFITSRVRIFMQIYIFENLRI